jgi:hypothetical protein
MGQEQGRKKDEEMTGRDLPNSDGTVSDEDINAIDDRGHREGGQDHSLENYGETIPEHGVGRMQNANDTTSDVARIRED